MSEETCVLWGYPLFDLQKAALYPVSYWVQSGFSVSLSSAETCCKTSFLILLSFDAVTPKK